MGGLQISVNLPGGNKQANEQNSTQPSTQTSAQANDELAKREALINSLRDPKTGEIVTNLGRFKTVEEWDAAATAMEQSFQKEIK